MEKDEMMGYEKALGLTLETVSPLCGNEKIDLAGSLGRVVFEDLYSQVNSPSIDASMKDGYAVRSGEISQATGRHPVKLTIIGVSAAGGPADRAVTPGTAIRILTGAKVPEGADAVLAEEFSHREGEVLTVFDTAGPGRNILAKGADVSTHELIARKGSNLTPGLIGTLAAAGFGSLPVYPRPRVAIIATGDELVIPGQPLADGKLYASNLEMLKAWCLKYGMPTSFFILKDRPDVIKEKIESLMAGHDALITSGGAWTGDRDFVADTLETLGWKKCFHSIRIGPGKPVGFGMLDKKPVFVLPGGPPSNLTAFLQIALPGLLRLGGHHTPSLPKIMVKLAEEVTSRHIDWTQFVYGKLDTVDGYTVFKPLKLSSRLKSMAGAQGVVAVPEGVKSYPAGSIVSAQLFI